MSGVHACHRRSRTALPTSALQAWSLPVTKCIRISSIVLACACSDTAG